jgi:lipoyl(octanoyl) transferase
MPPVEWTTSAAPVPYPRAVRAMEARAAAIHAGDLPEQVWLLEHPPLYTAGTSADPAELLEAGRLPVHPTGRGGRYIYHGPGQRIAYVMLDLGARGRDVRRYVRNLEEWVIRTLARVGVAAGRREGLVGIWTPGGTGDAAGEQAKIAAIGVRVRRWVTFHGVAINVDPDLTAFAGIVPCGIRDAGVTSLAALGIAAGLDELDAALRAEFERSFPPPA